MKNPTLILIVLLSISNSFGQNIEYDEENWLGEFGYSKILPLRNYFFQNRFTKEDVAKAKEKLTAIRNSNFIDEWEGYYQQWGDLNQFGLIWNSNSGFIHYNIYTCNIELRGLGFGNVIKKSDFVKFNYEKSIYTQNPKKKDKKTQSIYTKVRIGNSHFLVPEARLKDFCRYAVGRKYGLAAYEDYINYWWKVADKNNKIKGLPILPAQFKHLVVLPVDAKITKLGKTIITPSKEKQDNIEYGDVLHFVTISAGKDQNVEKGMDIYISELDETATVEKVYSKTSIAIVYRDFYETKVERCWDNTDGKHDIIPCPEIKVGMSAITKSPFE